MKTLLLPVAGKSARYPGMRPKWLLTMPNGKLMIEQSVSKINCNKFDKIYVIALKEYVDKYINPSRLVESLKKYIKKVELLLKKTLVVKLRQFLNLLSKKN